MILDNNRNRFTLYGALFGLSFPLLSLLIISFFTTNIWTLFFVICSAPIFLGFFSRLAGLRQDKLNDINRGLEKIIKDRTAAIKNMLDTAGQGFLSFGPDLKIRGNYSEKCEDIFNQKIAGKRINELLFDDEEKQNDFKDGFFLLFNGKAKAEVIFDLMEKEMTIGDKIIDVDYRIINSEEILCVLTDVTIEKVLQQKLEKDNENRNIILQVISHQKYFSSFVQEAEHLFDFMSLIEKTGTVQDFEKLQRDIHTFKGNASFFSFNNTKDTAHELEFYINDCLILEEKINLEEQSLVLKKSYFSELGIIQNTFGDQWVHEIDNVMIPQRNYLKLEQYIEKKYREDEDLKTAISGGQMQVLPERYENLINSFVHLIRNMVDHGIETPREREMINKPSRGKIHIEIESSKQGLQIIFADDGRGISLSAIEKKAREKGLVQEQSKMKPGELIKLIFSHNFSTASEITDISGRGAGLSAVKSEVDKMKGRISVTTKQNQGTTFKIILPAVS